MHEQGVDPQVGILKQAINDDDTTKILQLLQENPIHLAAVDENGDTVLHFFLQSNKFSPQLGCTMIIEIMDTFINRAVDPSIINKCEETILHLASAERLKDVVDYLLKRQSNVNVIDENGNSIAHHFVESSMERFRKLYKRSALRSDCVETEIKDGSNFVEWLLSRGIDFDLKNREGQSALLLAMEYNLQHILPSLLSRTRDVNVVEKFRKQNLLQLFLETSYPDKWRSRSPSGEWYEGRNSPVGSDVFPPELSVQIVQILVKRGVRVDLEEEDGSTALYLVLNKVQVPIVLMMLDRVANFSDELTMKLVRGIFKYNVSRQAYVGNLKILEKLIAKGVNLNSKDEHGKTCLYHAIVYDGLEAVEMMKEGGTLDFGVLTNDGENLLHALAEQNVRMLQYKKLPDTVKEAIFDLLVSEGCNVRAKNCKGQTPLHWAARRVNFTVAQKLIAHGADVNSRDCVKQSCPLHEVSSQGSTELAELLLDNGADVNSKSKDGRPLHLAINLGGRKVLPTLLKYKAEVNARDHQGNTTLAKALSFGRREIPRYNARSFEESLQALLEHGADINDASIVRILLRCMEKHSSKILLQHWTKLRTANLPCSNRYQTRVVANEEYQRLREDCLREIDVMKRTFIDSHKSLHGRLHMDPNRRHIYSHNKKLQKIVNSATINEQFPQYSTVILGNYRETLARRERFEPAKEAWSRLTDIYLPDICLERIFAHLNTGDMFEMAEILDEPGQS